MKRVFFVLCAIAFSLLLCCVDSVAQTVQPENIYAAGITFNDGASPAVAGTGLFAHKLTDSTYAFSVADFLPASRKPFTVTSNISAGVAQRVLTIGKVNFFMPTAAGISFSGNNTGWAFSSGILASVPIQNKNNLRLMPNLRFIKSSVNQGSGYQIVAGFMIGWGK